MPEGLRRPTPPELEFRGPDCTVCYTETEGDGDGFHCSNCGIWWDTGGRNGEWNDGDEPGCPSVIEWYNTPELLPKYEIIRNERERCIWQLDHPDRHKSFDGHEWDDDDPRVVRV